MKKHIGLLLLYVTVFCTLSQSTVSAENYFSAETIPFNVSVNDVVFTETNLEYPVFVRRELEYPVFFRQGIIYIPLTYFNLNLLGINIEIKDNTVEIHKNTNLLPREYSTVRKKDDSIELWRLSPFDIKTEGKMYTDAGSHPFMFYKNILYMPLTWEIMTDFGWYHTFDGEDFKLYTDTYAYTANGDSYIYKDEEGRTAYCSVSNYTYYKNGDIMVTLSTKGNRWGPNPSNLIIRKKGNEIKISGYSGYYQKNGPLFYVEDGYVYTVHYDDPDERNPRKCKVNIETGDIIYLDFQN